MGGRGLGFPSRRLIAEGIIDELLQRGSVQARDMYAILAKRFNLTEEQWSVRLDSGRETAWTNEVCWARRELVGRRIIDNSQHGVWSLTPEAKDKLRGSESILESIPEQDSEPEMLLVRGYREPDFEEIWSHFESTGMLLERDLLLRYHCSLKSRRFVILCGVSGTGKTWITEEYARAVDAPYKLVSVAPNWTSNEDLLGFLNPIDNIYRDTEFSSFIRAAAAEYQTARSRGERPKPFHVVLDEMNLARVEYYFAKFLSVMEILARKEFATIYLGTEELHLAQNLYFIGTVNIDETTHGFSDKVFDRAQVLEMKPSRDLLMDRVADEPFSDLIIKLWEITNQAAPFSYRTVDDIAAYIEVCAEVGKNWESALDDQIMQKILPKFRGNSPSLADALSGIAKIFADVAPRSAEKANQMLIAHRDHGFCSFF